jgi:benzoyl-CoA reductase/2-hydroxyglutaryl-CoA dehydratase subunit BcrC/BadD/HgdB
VIINDVIISIFVAYIVYITIVRVKERKQMFKEGEVEGAILALDHCKQFMTRADIELVVKELCKNMEIEVKFPEHPLDLITVSRKKKYLA